MFLGKCHMSTCFHLAAWQIHKCPISSNIQQSTKCDTCHHVITGCIMLYTQLPYNITLEDTISSSPLHRHDVVERCAHKWVDRAVSEFPWQLGCQLPAFTPLLWLLSGVSYKIDIEQSRVKLLLQTKLE